MAERLNVMKTWKLFIGGAFPRTESGRSLVINDRKGKPIAHSCQASRKDLRNAVQAARKASTGWAKRTAYNRGQILYRMAEMLEGKSEEAAALLAATVPGGMRRARKEVQESVDRLVNFAGWADKYQQVLGNSNPVAAPFYNFTVPEAVGVVGIIAPDEEPLLGLVSLLAPAITAGNSVIALGSEAHPLATSLLGEVCATSDVPDGVINLLCGLREEILPILAGHRDVDAVMAVSDNQAERESLRLGAAENVKRVQAMWAKDVDFYNRDQCCSPYWIEPMVEFKTIWHPSAS